MTMHTCVSVCAFEWVVGRSVWRECECVVCVWVDVWTCGHVGVRRCVSEYIVSAPRMCARQPGELLRRAGEERGSRAGVRLWMCLRKLKSD